MTTVADILLACLIGCGVLLGVLTLLAVWILWMEALEDGEKWATYPIIVLTVIALGFSVFSIGWAVVR